MAEATNENQKPEYPSYIDAEGYIPQDRKTLIEQSITRAILRAKRGSIPQPLEEVVVPYREVIKPVGRSARDKLRSLLQRNKSMAPQTPQEPPEQPFHIGLCGGYEHEADPEQLLRVKNEMSALGSDQGALLEQKQQELRQLEETGRFKPAIAHTLGGGEVVVKSAITMPTVGEKGKVGSCWAIVDERGFTQGLFFSESEMEHYVLNAMNRRTFLIFSGVIGATAAGAGGRRASRLHEPEGSMPEVTRRVEGSVDDFRQLLGEYLDNHQRDIGLQRRFAEWAWQNDNNGATTAFVYTPVDHYTDRYVNAMADTQEFGHNAEQLRLYGGDVVSVLPQNSDFQGYHSLVDALNGSRNPDPNMGVEATRRWARYTSTVDGGGMCGLSSLIYEAGLSQWVTVNGEQVPILVPVDQKYHPHKYESYNGLFGPTIYQDSTPSNSTHYVFKVNPKLAEAGYSVLLSTQTGMIPEEYFAAGVDAALQYNDWVEGGWQERARQMLNNGEIQSMDDVQRVLDLVPHIGITIKVETAAGNNVAIETNPIHNSTTYVDFLSAHDISGAAVEDAINAYNRDSESNANDPCVSLETDSRWLAIAGVMRRLGFVPDYLVDENRVERQGGMRMWDRLSEIYSDEVPLIKGDDFASQVGLMRIMVEQGAIDHHLETNINSFSLQEGQIAIAYGEQGSPSVFIKGSGNALTEYQWDSESNQFHTVSISSNDQRDMEFFVFPAPEVETAAEMPVLVTSFAPYGSSRVNGSTETLTEFENANAQYGSFPNVQILRNIPVHYDHDNADTNRQAAEDIIRKLETDMPDGGIVVMLGESNSLEGDDLVRVERYTNTTASDIGDDTTSDRVYEVPDELYQQIVDHLDHGGYRDRLQEVEARTDTAGDFICEITLNTLQQYSEQKLEENPPVKYLPLFVHVPRGAAEQDVVRMIDMIVESAQSYYFANRNSTNTAAFVVHSAPHV